MWWHVPYVGKVSAWEVDVFFRSVSLKKGVPLAVCEMFVGISIEEVKNMVNFKFVLPYFDSLVR